MIAMKGLKKKELVSIGDVRKFIANSNEQVPFMLPTLFKIYLSPKIRIIK